MNTFKKKSLYLAVAGASALGAGTASAVTLNADGLGEVLLYPYYTVRETSPGNAYNSLLSVVNSTASAKAVKVRFLEGKNSREVLDFNLYLSKKDVWVTAIIPTSDGAAIVTPDNSCTDGIVSQDENNPTPFVNYAYIGDNDDPANDDLDRTREGYVEIIEMGGMWGYGATVVTHDSTGVPRNCSYIRGSFTGNGQPRAEYFTSNPGGGLFGTMTLINVNTGIDFGYDATALAGFSDNQIWYAPGLPNPPPPMPVGPCRRAESHAPRLGSPGTALPSTQGPPCSPHRRPPRHRAGDCRRYDESLPSQAGSPAADEGWLPAPAAGL